MCPTVVFSWQSSTLFRLRNRRLRIIIFIVASLTSIKISETSRSQTVAGSTNEHSTLGKKHRAYRKRMNCFEAIFSSYFPIYIRMTVFGFYDIAFCVQISSKMSTLFIWSHLYCPKLDPCPLTIHSVRRNIIKRSN